MANRKTIVIIGGGVSGLSAGIYAQQHGFDAIIVEKHNIVGGLCTGWDRKGYHIDGCIHWLTGTKENTILNEMWKNLGAFESQDDILQLNSWGSFNYQGTVVTFWRDLDRAEREWTEISPDDKKRIHSFFNKVRDFCEVELPLDLPVSFLPLKRIIGLGLKVMSIWPSYISTMHIKTDSYAKKFKHPALRFALENVQPGPGNLFSMLYSYSTVVIGDGGIPKGGSKAMAQRMADKFVSLGGTLLLNSPVHSVLVENKTAIGVELNDGKKILGDYVVSCLDANYALNRLLLGQYSLPLITHKIKKPETYPTPSCCLLGFAVDKNISVKPPYSFKCEPFYVGGVFIDHITIRPYSYDSSFDRGDKTTMTVLLDQYNYNYNFWKNLRKNPVEYRKYKEDIAKAVMSRIVKHLPEVKDSIEVLDVATPITLSRYTNVTKGAYMGFLFTHNRPMFSYNGHVPGLKHFFLSGQWMQAPGGLPLAIAQGKFAIQRICKIEKLNYIFSPVKATKKQNV